MPKTAVVILNWNGTKFLRQYLPSVVDYSLPSAEVFVIDNASTDESIAFIQQNFPQIHIVTNDRNYGFAQGYNEGLKHIDAEYYCLLNSDVEVSPDWLEGIISFMDNNKDVAVCQPKLLSYLHKDEFEYAGAAGGFIDKYGYPFCRGRLFTCMEKDKGQYDDIAELFWATGACMFVRSDIYRSLGGLDDDFFTHMEEIDFCWRVKNAGYRVMCYPKSVVYHYGGGTLQTGSPKKTYYNFRNNLIMLYKNLPTHRLFPVFCMRFFYDIIAALRFLFDSGIRDFFAVFKAHLSFIKGFKKSVAKRRMLKNKPYCTKMYKKDIILQYFFLKKKKYSDLNPNDFY
ncbi:MAG: glycosyltransferase family 2 protein [Bacteroidales bacterium]|nr:glycosyltransferase family 2 protein [Bacteroidales bacterium]